VPRPSLTPKDRANNVAASVATLPDLFRVAYQNLRDFGPSDARTLAAWEAVETEGATVHRQARLLAGKSKGG
jgi:hypothetical protein